MYFVFSVLTSGPTSNRSPVVLIDNHIFVQLTSSVWKLMCLIHFQPYFAFWVFLMAYSNAELKSKSDVASLVSDNSEYEMYQTNAYLCET
jgi:hypothetical protein